MPTIYPSNLAEKQYQQAAEAWEAWFKSAGDCENDTKPRRALVNDLRSLISNYPTVPNAYYLLSIVLKTTQEGREPTDADFDESIALCVRASELCVPHSGPCWAMSIASSFVDLTSRASAALPKPEWMSHDKLRLEYSAACIALAPQSIDAWEMRGLVCSSNNAPWLDWGPIPPRSRALLLESIYSYQQAAKFATEDSYRQQRALEKAGFSMEILDSTTECGEHVIAAMDGKVRGPTLAFFAALSLCLLCLPTRSDAPPLRRSQRSRHGCAAAATSTSASATGAPCSSTLLRRGRPRWWRSSRSDRRTLPRLASSPPHLAVPSPPLPLRLSLLALFSKPWQALIKLGADLNLQIETGDTALITTITHGHLGAFNALLRFVRVIGFEPAGRLPSVLVLQVFGFRRFAATCLCPSQYVRGNPVFGRELTSTWATTTG